MTVKVCALGDFFLAPELFPEILKRYCGDEIEFAVHKMPPGPMISGEHGDAIREYSGNEDQVIEWAKDADAVLVHIAPVSRRVIDALPNLKFIGVGRGGPVNVDQAAAAERNIVLANAPGRNAGAVAEFTVGAIISTSREIAMGTMEMKANEWSRVHYHYENTGLELSEMTIGLIGYAHIGRIVGRLLCAFGAKVIFFDPYQDQTEEDKKRGILKVGLDELCRSSDTVSLHTRLTDETASMCDGDFFSKLKPGCILINTARGELVDQKALLEHLISGSVGAAFLDTFNPEPPQSDDPLIHHPKVFTTPHIAGASKTSAHIAVNVISKALSEWINDNR
jgi:D-3-phosphoglycerate dehydrogenase / 2-oxoglutarate reductase|tara:strand:+ start:1381 stop:2391 length:1011 start_codon:yes stop_codon:yes gene_type:complete